MEYEIKRVPIPERKLLEGLLYEAIFVPDGVQPPSRDIIRQPELALYIDDFGKADDFCLVAFADEAPLGGVLARIMDDYGHIEDNTPSLLISLVPEHRNQGIGTALLASMLELLESTGYGGVSLSVQKENYAVRMYLKAGFEIIEERGPEYLMRLSF